MYANTCENKEQSIRNQLSETVWWIFILAVVEKTSEKSNRKVFASISFRLQSFQVDKRFPIVSLTFENHTFETPPLKMTLEMRTNKRTIIRVFPHFSITNVTSIELNEKKRKKSSNLLLFCLTFNNWFISISCYRIVWLRSLTKNDSIFELHFGKYVVKTLSVTLWVGFSVLDSACAALEIIRWHTLLTVFISSSK